MSGWDSQLGNPNLAYPALLAAAAVSSLILSADASADACETTEGTNTAR